MFDSISLFLVHSQLPNTVKNKVCFQTICVKTISRIVYATPRSVSDTLYKEEQQSQTMTAF